ncbi:S49 family peptidase [Hymenobacter chitinivorans]|uniref:Signal peptide peptidase SppA n=1 Tax=Hymenobacter chitinivorans DSM 11115 TaxID=1121954 RepID=A0A2M9BN92_9BACT|nr:S49 family peptidase [Hymenobacter chitinivorans]PJJ59428.1 signal peptide peptidase SppA [Hymenobacter chitinivorans DSM 11115]
MSLEHAQSYLPLVAGLLTGSAPLMADQNMAELRAAAAPADYVATLGARGGISYAARAAAGLSGGAAGSTDGIVVRVMGVNGPLMKADQECGPRGLMSLANDLQRASRDTEISAVLLRIDSPGGQVFGTQSVVDGVKACQAAGKPVVALCEDGLMCSAAYWIGSAADTIIVTHETCTIGSIGIMASWMDVQPYLASLGVKFHEVYAEQSKQKNADFAAAAKGDYKAVQANLTAIATGFLGDVRTNRGSRLDTKLFEKSGAAAGKTFFASQAGDIGLIDAIGSFSDAIGECVRLVQAGGAGK